jgi:hypothetical protein
LRWGKLLCALLAVVLSDPEAAADAKLIWACACLFEIPVTCLPSLPLRVNKEQPPLQPAYKAAHATRNAQRATHIPNAMASSPPPAQEPALATTKRKFDTLLGKLQHASASTTSLANTLRSSNASTASFSLPATPEPALKRHRLSDTGMDRSRQVSGSERIQQLKSQLLTPRKEGLDRIASPGSGGLRVVGQHQTSVKSTTPRKPANYQPYSQEQFLARLKTFADVKKWTNKPDALGEVEWAKRGWSCDSWNTVACKGGCEKRLVVRLRPKRKDNNMSEDLAVDVDLALVDKYREFMVDAHREDCLWKKRGCSGRPRGPVFLCES